MGKCDKGYLSIKSAARYADVCPRLVRRWIAEGLYHSRMNQKLILIPKGALDQWIMRHGTTTKESERIIREMEGELRS
jgi:hypothetical protein